MNNEELQALNEIYLVTRQVKLTADEHQRLRDLAERLANYLANSERKS